MDNTISFSTIVLIIMIVLTISAMIFVLICSGSCSDRDYIIENEDKKENIIFEYPQAGDIENFYNNEMDLYYPQKPIRGEAGHGYRD